MTNNHIIIRALQKGPVRCCVAQDAVFGRGTTGSLCLAPASRVLKRTSPERVYFAPDRGEGGFWMDDTSGLHVPSLGIFKP